MKTLTKSKCILGLECYKHLWITFNQPEKIRKVTLAEVMIVEQLAKLSF